jgi:hypothetical protein
MHVEEKFMEVITICCPKKSPFGVVVQWLKT